MVNTSTACCSGCPLSLELSCSAVIILPKPLGTNTNFLTVGKPAEALHTPSNALSVSPEGEAKPDLLHGLGIRTG